MYTSMVGSSRGLEFIVHGLRVLRKEFKLWVSVAMSNLMQESYRSLLQVTVAGSVFLVTLEAEQSSFNPLIAILSSPHL